METFKKWFVTVTEVVLFVLFGKHAGQMGGEALEGWAGSRQGPHRPDPAPARPHRKAS